MSPRSRRALLAALALLVIAGTAIVGTAVATGGDTAYSQQETPTDGENQSKTVIKVTLQSDSDARWTITEHFDVSSQAERDSFESLAQRFEDERTVQLGLPVYRTSLERVQSTVDRSMEISDVTRRTSVENGTLSVSFTWTNFARKDNETRYVDDAFTTTSGTWFDSLGPNQSLIIELPGGTALDTPKRVTDGTIRWDGPTEFDPGYLQITYTADKPAAIPPMLWGVVVALLVFAVLGVVGGYLVTRRRDGLTLPEIPIGDGSEANETAAAADDSGTGPADRSADGAATEEDSTDDGVDLSLLSDEERVEYLIEENGGRMKQANIVKETGWSNAKVSQLLSAMEEDGRIAKLRIGRENLISFPDEDIGDFEDS